MNLLDTPCGACHVAGEFKPEHEAEHIYLAALGAAHVIGLEKVVGGLCPRHRSILDAVLEKQAMRKAGVS